MANVKATDLIEYTRASKGHALAKISLGEELVTNGTFDTDSDWDVQSYWSIADGKATKSPGSSRLKQELNVSAGTIYQITLTVTRRAGNLTVSLGGDALPVIDSSGIFNLIAVCGSSTSLLDLHGGGTTDCDVDNISVKEVLFNQADGTLQLFEHPNNIPRIEYDVDGNLLGLLIERQRTNQFIQSENFVSSAWGRTRAVPVRDAVGPTGVANSAVTLSDDASGNSSTVYISEAVTGLTTGNDYTASVFAKKGSLNFLGLRTQSLGLTSATAYFDLANGTLGTIGSDLTATIKDYGNGWYRCSITFTATSDTSGTIRIQMWEQDAGGNFLHDGTKNILIFGAQLEEGSFPTSYIKTTGSTAARSADVASIDVDQFGYNKSEGTLFAVAQNIAGNTTDPRVVTLSDGTSDNRIRIDVNDGNNIRMTVSDGGVSQTSTQNTFNDYDSQYKVAFAFKENDFKLLVNNSITLTDSSGTVPDDITTVYIGSNFNATSGHLNGHIKSIKYFPKRLSNAKLQELTS